MRLSDLASLIAPPLCWGCSSAAAGAEHLCHRCRAELLWLGSVQPGLAGLTVWAPVAYQGPAQELVRALKYRGARAVAATMAAQMAANAPWPALRRQLSPAAGWSLVPVPLASSRQRRRGFNQAQAIADELAVRTGLPVAGCLRRTGRAASQVGRQRAERLVAPLVSLRGGSSCPARALLVDDVVTTGATLSACAAALRAAGVAEVAAVAYARTLAR